MRLNQDKLTDYNAMGVINHRSDKLFHFKKDVKVRLEFIEAPENHIIEEEDNIKISTVIDIKDTYHETSKTR